MQFHYEETYNGSDIEIFLLSHTGEGTHTMQFTVGGAEALPDDTTVTDENLREKFAAALEAIKNEIDGVEDGELQAIMDELGFATQEDTPANFVASGMSDHEILLDWDIDPTVEEYHIWINTVDDFDTATNVINGALSEPLTVDSLTANTHYYIWMNASRAGVDDSEYVKADATTLP